MWNQYYIKRAIKKEVGRDNNLQFIAVQKVRELNWDNFKVNESFLTTFKKVNRILSRRHNKLITRAYSFNKNTFLYE
jgi:hypothetical protein